MARELYLIRHGRTAFNKEGRFQGQIDIPLDETGEQQAHAIAITLQNCGITRIFASDLTRARSTAQALATATGLQVTLDEGLREISVGEWEGFTRDEIEQKWPGLLAKWKSGVEVRPPGGESRLESSQRVYDSVHRLLDTCDDTDVVAMVAHGAVIRGATELMMGLSSETNHARLGVLDNCEYVHFVKRNDAWMLRRFAGGACA